MILVVVVVGIIAWFTNNTITNLHERGIASGFDFLGKRAGFDMMTFLNTNVGKHLRLHAAGRPGRHDRRVGARHRHRHDPRA